MTASFRHDGRPCQGAGRRAAIRLPLALALSLGLPSLALAQAFGTGPIATVPGSSVSGMRIDGAPVLPKGRQIPNVRVFGDTVEERAYGRDYDDSYLRPRIPNVGRDLADEGAIELRAREGRSALDPSTAGVYARDGAASIGGSAVTRGRSQGPSRAIIRRAPAR
ncbi:hypothetical protein [Aurantimonas sp. Leaf443]|uniref:hypothetical protein n=1 Tax=Aurantimonas sp. Leaf443 TaxID=1736378 RepID=UPI0006FEBB5E|nr:hypothetical protein [Aurantimonas sp. Leaf443]KQT85204.1 hypothetical protein ASG48_08035 [Aurantimonas sp. Leaf443]